MFNDIYIKTGSAYLGAIVLLSMILLVTGA